MQNEHSTLLNPSDARAYDALVICSFQRRPSKKGVNHFEVTGTLLHVAAATYQWLRLQ
jgi:hypothetical protein